MLSNRTASSGLALGVILPWLVAAAAVAFGAFSWLSESPVDKGGGALGDEDPKALRVALDAAREESAVLRRELDRLAASRPASQGAGSVNPGSGVRSPAPAAVSSRIPRERVAELASELEQLASTAGSNPAAGAEAQKRVMALLADGRAAFPTLTDVYMNVHDPKGKLLMLPAMIFTGGQDAYNFVIQQAETETDPLLRSVLAGQAAKYATPAEARRLEPNFVEALETSSEPGVQKFLLQGLRHSQTETATAALLRAAAASDEGVRLAAIDVLASRPNATERLRELVAGAPENVRHFTECRVLVAEALRGSP